jgi:hypothetical protein
MSALSSAIDEFMTGKYGRPMTLVEVITWLFNQLINPTHPIGKSFENAEREEDAEEDDLLDLLKDPKKLKVELESFLSPGIINYSTSIERVLLGQLRWSQVPIEFMMVWIFGKNRWTVESANPVEAGGTKRVAFIVRNPYGVPHLFVSASGATDEEAEEQGQAIHDKFSEGFAENIPRYMVTLSTENKGSFSQGMPNVIRLHYLSTFLISRA